MSRKKNNDWLARQQQQHAVAADRMIKRAIWITEMQCRDAMCIALNSAFGFGKDRLGKFITEFEDTLMWIATTQQMDINENGDKNWGYTKSKLDAKLKRILPEDRFQPYEDRYGYAENSIGRRSI